MKTIDLSYFIERYNAGEMNEAEKIWFVKEMEGNEKLRREVILRRKTDDVLKNNNIIQLRNKLADIEKQRTAATPAKKTGRSGFLRYAAVIAVLILIGSTMVLTNHKFSTDELLDKYDQSYTVATVSRSLETGTSSDYTVALEYFGVHDYNNAAIYFSKVLSTDPKHIESTMLYGVARYNEKNYPEAEKSFVTITSDNNNLYIEDAQWYLALCYLKTDQVDKASAQLSIIKNSDSIYRKDAGKILRSIK
jgi:tetratricopeptide (TPR) repeat protein